MSGLRSFSPAAGAQPERNDPCPCGSGLKYKKCCAIRPRGAQPVAPARVALGTLTAQGREVAGNATVNWVVRQNVPHPSGAPRVEKPAPAPGRAQTPSSSPATARLLGEARRLRAAGRVEDAIPLFRQVVRLDPNNAAVRLEFGSALLDYRELAEAVDNLATAARLDPKLATAHFQLGQALSRQGRANEAMAAYRAAIAAAPRFGDAHHELGFLLYVGDHTEIAAEEFDKAAEAAPGTTKGRIAAVRALIARNRREEAIQSLRRARALDPTSDVVAHLLGRTLAEMGRIDEAEQELTKALAVIPRGAGLWFELTTLRRMTPSDRPLIERISAVLQAGDLRHEDQVMLHFALGKLHDDLREFEAAIGHYDAGNRIRAGNRLLDRRTVTRKADRLITLFPRGMDWEGRACGSEDERPVLIVGMPRSGTTLVEQILSSHPQVAAGGELGFWAQHGQLVLTRGPDELTAEALQSLAAPYQSLLHQISPEALRVTDKNPFNFTYLGLISLTFPRAFIIHCRRHPVDNCVSIYSTYFEDNKLSFMGNREDLVFYYRQYERLMRHWREVLPPERFLVVDYEKLVSDREAETRRLISFCKLEWDAACLQPERNTRAVDTASVWQARQPVYRSSVERWRNYEPWLGALAELMPAPEAPT